MYVPTCSEFLPIKRKNKFSRYTTVLLYGCSDSAKVNNVSACVKRYKPFYPFKTLLIYEIPSYIRTPNRC